MSGNELSDYYEVFVVGFAVGAATASLLWWAAGLFTGDDK